MSKTKHLDIIYAILLAIVPPYGVCFILKINIPQITLRTNMHILKERRNVHRKTQVGALVIKSVKKYLKTLCNCNFSKNLKRQKMLTSARCSNTSG